MAVAIVDVSRLEVSEAVDMLGRTVRVQLANDNIAEGVVQQWTVSTFEVREADGSVSRFDLPEVRQVLQYRSRGHAGEGFWIGALLGGAALGAYSGVTWEPCSGFICVGPGDRSTAAALGAILGVVAGGGVGALLGAAARTSSWEPVISPVVSPNSSTLGLRVRWSMPR